MPAYLPPPPTDPFAGAPLGLQAGPEGVRFSSVGPDGRPGTEDDMVLTVPPPPATLPVGGARRPGAAG